MDPNNTFPPPLLRFRTWVIEMRLPLLFLLAIPAVESFLFSPEQRSTVSRTWNSARSVLAEPPRKGPNNDGSAASESSDLLQPIRRLRRDKKEPLIAVVGRPNVVSEADLADQIDWK
jgi:hypothetical protein